MLPTLPMAMSALRCALKKRFDYIFLDISMPRLDGFETIKRLRPMLADRGMDTPIICITGETDGGRRKEILDAGFSEVMSKPINKKVLEKMLLEYAPPGKVIIDESEQDEEEEEIRLPDWIHSVPEIDAQYGVEHCGSVPDFLNALRVFNNSINEKAVGIETNIKKGDLESLKFIVHSLKSTSGAVGAKRLSEMAKLLEKACSQHNISLVYSLTPEFLDRYRGIGEELRKYWMSDTEEGKKRDISERELKDALSTVEELMETYDLRNIDIILKSLESYSLPDKWKDFFDSVGEHLKKMNWEKARYDISEFKRRL